MGWKILLTGKAAAMVSRLVAEIAEALAQEASPDGSYAKGESGPALFFGYRAVVQGGSRMEDFAWQRLARAAEWLGSGKVGSLGFFGGAAGVAWVYTHLSQLLGDAVDESATREVDEAIAEAVQERPWRWDFDLISGLAGLGCYALDHPETRFAREVIREIIQRLDELAERGPLGVTWRSHRESPPHQERLQPRSCCYDLGLAHGIAGIVGFLGRVCSQGMGDETATQLLTGAVEWLLAHRRDSEHGSVFSRFFTEEESGSCRSAWCYGDAGVATALHWAAKGAGNARLGAIATAVGLRDCSRGLAAPGVRNAGLCHGTAGLAHLYNRLYQATGEVAFARASHEWLKRTIAMHRPGFGIAGYAHWHPGSGRWRKDPGLLTGAAGVGLALLAATSSVEPSWDRPLLLGLPSRLERVCAGTPFPGPA